MRVLLISDVAPTEALTAGAILDAFVDAIPRPWTLTSIVIGDPALSYEMNPKHRGDVLATQKPRITWTAVRSQRAARLGEAWSWRVEVPSIAGRCQAVVDLIEPDVVLFAAQCQVVTAVALRLETRSAIRIAFMWDHPSWWARAHSLPNPAANRFVSQWLALLNSSDLAVLPSDRAHQLIDVDSGPRAITLYPRVAAQSLSAAASTGDMSAPLRLVFIGQTYAISELRSLVDMLEELEWQVEGRSVELHTFGREALPFRIPHIHSNGWLPPVDLVEAIATFDAAVLPYPSSPDMSIVAETSFPSKLAVYSAANLPVIYIGPASSAVWEFLRDEGLGLRIDTSSAYSLQAAITTVRGHRVDFQNRSATAYSRFFSPAAFGASVAQAIGACCIPERPRQTESSPSGRAAALEVWVGDDSAASARIVSEAGEAGSRTFIWHRGSGSQRIGRYARASERLVAILFQLLKNVRSQLPHTGPRRSPRRDSDRKARS